MSQRTIQIPQHRLIDILNESSLYTEAPLTLDQTSYNARQIVAALSGMLSIEHEDIANLLAERIGLTPTHKSLTQVEQVIA